MQTEPQRDAHTAETADGFAAVAAVLWTEREALEQVLYYLQVEQLVLTAGATRWLNHADADLRVALERLRTTEVLRAAEASELASSARLPFQLTLAQLAAVAPDPWGMVLSEHRAALRSLVAEIDSLAMETRRLLADGAAATAETLAAIGSAMTGYDADGSVAGLVGLS